MDRLLIAGGRADLGPNSLDPSRQPQTLVHVNGPRPSRLRAEVRTLCPHKPGIYGMIDRHGELIYIGKAKSLRARLLSYFRPRSRGPRAGRILRRTQTILWETSPSEFAALHRELELIRRWRPRCNVQGQPLRRQFTHVCIGRAPAAYVFLSRRPPANVSAWFGPVPLGQRAREAVRRLNDLFQLRDCPQAQEMFFSDQADLFATTLTFGCLRYELGTCLGPCAAACSRKGYTKNVRLARAFLAGENQRLLEELEQTMATAAAAEQFERAAALRDRILPLRWLASRLEQMRRARTEGSFIYPVKGLEGHDLWYLIHGGRAIAAVEAPVDSSTARAAAHMIDAIYRKDPAAVLNAYEHADGLMLVALWFRKHVRERAKTLTPADARARCAMVGVK